VRINPELAKKISPEIFERLGEGSIVSKNLFKNKQLSFPTISPATAWRADGEASAN
jgi:hypothetical protein